MSIQQAEFLENVHIRPMLDEDVPVVQKIDQESFPLPWPASAFDFELNDNPGSLLWVAEIDQPGSEKMVVGMIVIWLIVDEAHVATIAVLPEFRGRNIAKKLITTALNTAADLGMKTATLEVRAYNIAAQNLYRSFGFEIVGKRPRYYRDNFEDAILMTLPGLHQGYFEELPGFQTTPANGNKL